ncbi:SPOR domain-containing protein [Pseudorhodoferax sp. Leaf274]|uniref:SPOR domain-containing protein n=1 Tax=Pseudorhodoferax sp. Leaf274 TaxID=1736318 RepID=UPI000703BFEB|nr:SPOR domain-containing protein [Pseudorhodoferax sp. Leaf274]KQP49882.1 hypothetical protein ASF44_04755 [Pseudorhodoferax sp. Leaf274]
MLYRAAIGPDRDGHYLQRFQALDAGAAQAPRTRRWHWGAFASAVAWLAWRGLIGTAALWAGAALLGSVLALGLARLVFGADATQLALLLLGLTLAASLAWGLGAESLYHRVCSRRILDAVATHASVAQACAALQRRQPGRLGRWAALLALQATVLAALAGLALALRPLPAQPPAVRVAAAAPAGAQATAVRTAPVPAPRPEPVPAASPAAASAPAPATAPATDAPAAPPMAPQASAPGPAVPATTASTAAAAAEPRRAASPAAEAPPAATGPTGAVARYAVQIGVFAEAANAQAALARLQAAGLPARSETLAPSGQQRVRAGPFATQEQAQRAGERIRAQGLPAVVVRLPAAPQAKAARDGGA